MVSLIEDQLPTNENPDYKDRIDDENDSKASDDDDKSDGEDEEGEGRRESLEEGERQEVAKELALVNTRTGRLYRHGGVQTTKRERDRRTEMKRCRETQTAVCRSAKQQTCHDTSTQMTGVGVYVSQKEDRVVKAGKYVTADEVHARKVEQVIKLQAEWRGWLARRRVMRLKRGKKMIAEWRDAEVKRGLEMAEVVRRMERRRLQYPTCEQDMRLLYAGVHKWRESERDRIEGEGGTAAEKKAFLCGLLDEEARLLAACDMLAARIERSRRRQAVEEFFQKTVALKECKGRSHNSKKQPHKLYIQTGDHLRARHLQQLYHSLCSPLHQQEERLDVLLSLKKLLLEHDMQLTRELIGLVEREAELVVRGVGRLGGLRSRISTLFLEFCKNPSCNPQASLFAPVMHKRVKLKEADAGGGKDGEEEEDEKEYEKSRKKVVDEEVRQGFNNSLAFLIQPADLKFLTENIWESRSILSGLRGSEGGVSKGGKGALELVRWHAGVAWSPWNCALVTREEAAMHKKVDDLNLVYGPDVLDQVYTKHTKAFSHFSKFLKLIYTLKN